VNYLWMVEMPTQFRLAGWAECQRNLPRNFGPEKPKLTTKILHVRFAIRTTVLFSTDRLGIEDVLDGLQLLNLSLLQS
jgi:hypothetical protein